MHMIKLLAAASFAPVQAAYWMENIPHVGVASFNGDQSYKVFRNVKEFGAVGDGIHDDTAAINNAISTGHRCSLETACNGSTTTPAVVYFPSGTYLVSSPIVDTYYTQLIGDANDLPILKASANFKGNGYDECIINSDRYLPGGDGALEYITTNVFFRQLRNFVFDTREAPGTQCAVHWPSSQATSIQNCVFMLSTRMEDSHTGIFTESGSGGVMVDLIFYGGKYGAKFGNQQYTMRNLSFIGCETGIHQMWNWGWTYKSLSFQDCTVGINISAQDVGSVTLLDSVFTNVKTALLTGRALDNASGQGSLLMEGVRFYTTPVVLEGPGKQVFLAGDANGGVEETGHVNGNLYAPYGPILRNGRGEDEHFPRPAALLENGKFYERSKPQYESSTANHFLSARAFGARGNGMDDDSDALNELFKSAAANYRAGMIAFVDAGYYKVSKTLRIPPNVRIVGEGMAAVILGAGPSFSDVNNPVPVMQIGIKGETGYVEVSDLILSTQGATAGAKLIEYNLNTPASSSSCVAGSPPSGLWDVHLRIGGFAGSQLQVAQCPLNRVSEAVNPACIAAHTGLHITKSAGNLLMENNWLWVADHDIEDHFNTQISVYAGRGMLIESDSGRLWLYGTASEHFTLYQYQLVGTRDIFMGQVQTESPYYQPNPPAPAPFIIRNTELSDPDFETDCRTVVYGDGLTMNGTISLPGKPPCQMAWGLRVLGSHDIMIFGAGLYSFFNDNHLGCVAKSQGQACQARIMWISPIVDQVTTTGDKASLAVDGDGPNSMKNIEVYNLNTVGATSMISRLGSDVALWSSTYSTYASTVVLFRF